MNSHGIDTGLDFSDLASIRNVYEEVTRLTVPERQPYAGELVFTAFSGSHQDAIKKGFDLGKRETDENPDRTVPWSVPYLTIDPQDIGRSYEAIIRINSQSGKGGVAYVLDREHGFELPKTMHPQVGKFTYNVADEQGRELANSEIGDLFFANFVNVSSPLELIEFELDHTALGQGEVLCHATIRLNGEKKSGSGNGNGPINAFVHFMETLGMKDFHVCDYRSQALRGGSDADSAAYVQIQDLEGGHLLWGCGVDPSIEMAGLRALLCAWNLRHQNRSADQD